jgi:hypothetical protein
VHILEPIELELAAPKMCSCVRTGHPLCTASLTVALLSVLQCIVSTSAYVLCCCYCLRHTGLLNLVKPPFEHSFVRTTINNTAVLNFTSAAPAAPFRGFPYFVDYFGAEAACEQFVLHAKVQDVHAKQKDSQTVTRHLFIHGLVKSGKSTVLHTVFPAVARRHFPKALFWRVKLWLVSHIFAVTLPFACACRYIALTVARQKHCIDTTVYVRNGTCYVSIAILLLPPFSTSSGA